MMLRNRLQNYGSGLQQCFSLTRAVTLPPPPPFNLSTLPSVSLGLGWHRMGEEATPVSYGPRLDVVSRP